jgi:anti-anti-sigma regulatory factor
MDDRLTSPDDRSARTSITVGFRGRVDASSAESLTDNVLGALPPTTRRVVVDFSGVTACVDAVAAALVHVEEALIHDACLLEVVGLAPAHDRDPVRGRVEHGRHGPCGPRGPHHD